MVVYNHKKQLKNRQQMKYLNIREEELKNKVAQDYFWIHDTTKIIGNVDFCVCMHQNILPPSAGLGKVEQESLLWAEAKKGSSDVYKSLVQLILTIGKARTFDKFLPPAMLGAFDGEKIAFIPYDEIHEIFYTNDFNWNVTPSNHETKEFKLIHEKVKKVIDNKTLLFNYLKDDKELTKFIKNNFIVGKFGLTKTKIDKNNFIVIYNKWLQAVKPTIAVNWDLAKKIGIIDGDFYLADLLSQENNTLKEKLFVLLKQDHYELDRKIDEAGMFSSKQTNFTDKQVAHTQFWNRYDRPPKEQYWDYIVERRDLIVPQDVRERKGSFFTPLQWVELSQKYIADVLGEDWQDEYYIWDCAAGTGNLLANLTNKYNIWASTLDNQDVAVMHERIDTMNNNSPNGDGANLLKGHVFQFDFLNDDFTKLPKPLQEIINNPEKRKKLVVYINPPYAEAASTATITGLKENKKDVAVQTKMYSQYLNKIGIAGRELYVQFLTRIYCEIPDATVAQFSTLKTLQAPNFQEFRTLFKAKLKSLFVVPASTFDNVKGKFPIGFFIWNTQQKDTFVSVLSDVYDEKGEPARGKVFFIEEDRKTINDWIITTRSNLSTKDIGFMSAKGADFQNTNFVFIINDKSQLPHPRGTVITNGNLIEIGIYYSVRHCIKATWLNDRDQFLFPNDGWKTDIEFQNDCLTFTLFSNNIQSKYGTNHWIPFTEQEVNSREKFESNFMSKYIKGKLPPPKKSVDIFSVLMEPEAHYERPLQFSSDSKAVFDAGRELWKYYHAQPVIERNEAIQSYNPNASLYDIREHFQGRSEAGKMNNKSQDERYINLIGNLREKLNRLADKIQPKVYEYGFLKE